MPSKAWDRRCGLWPRDPWQLAALARGNARKSPIVALFRWRAHIEEEHPRPAAGCSSSVFRGAQCPHPSPLLRVVLTCEDTLSAAERDRTLRTLNSLFSVRRNSAGQKGQGMPGGRCGRCLPSLSRRGEGRTLFRWVWSAARTAVRRLLEGRSAFQAGAGPIVLAPSCRLPFGRPHTCTRLAASHPGRVADTRAQRAAKGRAVAGRSFLLFLPRCAGTAPPLKELSGHSERPK